MRATPLPPAVDLGARVIVAIVFAAVTLALLFVIAFLSGVHLGASGWLSLMVLLILGSLPLLGLSFTLANLAGPNAAVATVNLLYMVLAFGSGLLVPMNQLPSFVQGAAAYLPAYHYAQLGWSVLGVANEIFVTSLAWVAGFGIVFFATALWGVSTRCPAPIRVKLRAGKSEVSQSSSLDSACLAPRAANPSPRQPDPVGM